MIYGRIFKKQSFILITYKKKGYDKKNVLHISVE
jgi:hypothetical protein